MSAVKVALAGAVALAGPIIYAADPLPSSRAPAMSQPALIGSAEASPATPSPSPRRVGRVILASPFDPPGTPQEAAAVSPHPGVVEHLGTSGEEPVLLVASQVAPAAPTVEEEPAVRRKKPARHARMARADRRILRSRSLAQQIPFLSAFLR